jgi:hypothetical protein
VRACLRLTLLFASGILAANVHQSQAHDSHEPDYCQRPTNGAQSSGCSSRENAQVRLSQRIQRPEDLGAFLYPALAAESGISVHEQEAP